MCKQVDFIAKKMNAIASHKEVKSTVNIYYRVVFVPLPCV